MMIYLKSGRSLSISIDSSSYSVKTPCKQFFTHVEVLGHHPLLSPDADGITANVSAGDLLSIIASEGGVESGTLPPLAFGGLRYDGSD